MLFDKDIYRWLSYTTRASYLAGEVAGWLAGGRAHRIVEKWALLQSRTCTIGSSKFNLYRPIAANCDTTGLEARIEY